jgi:hypothetical protein
MNIKYIGRHDQFKDIIYGTNLVWVKGETVHPLADYFAERFLRHADSFASVPGDDAPLDIAPRNDGPEPFQEMHDMINAMRDVDSVASYVFTNFGGYKIDKGMTLQGAKDQAKMLFNQYGPEGGYIPIDRTKKEKVAALPVQMGGEGDIEKSEVLSALAAPMEERVMALHATGEAAKDIAKSLGIHHQTVAKIIRDNG